MERERKRLEKQLLAMEEGLRGVIHNLDQLNEAEVLRMGKEVDQLAFRYAKILNLHVEEM